MVHEKDGFANSSYFDPTMESLNWKGWLFWLAMLCTTSAMGQRMYCTAAVEDSLWAIDTTNWQVVQRSALQLSGYTVTGMTGMAYDPITHRTFGLVKTSALPNNSLLATVDLASGTCTFIGNLGARFSAITFREDGQMLGVVTDGGPFAENLFLIDKATAAKTLAAPLGNGDAGEVIAFHPANGQLYHWSGDTNQVFERLPATVPFGPIVGIPQMGSPATSVQGALAMPSNDFIVSDVLGGWHHVNVSGFWGPTFANTALAMSGLVMPPNFTFVDSIICRNERATFLLNGIVLDTVIYEWGDGNATHLYPADSASHLYAIAGSYPIHVILRNGQREDTLLTTSVLVRPLPGVHITPGLDTILCLRDTLILTGTYGGTPRWFRNGVLIPGTTTNVYAATQNGWYNMLKTNLNGCTDSAHVGVSVAFIDQVPAPSITYDTTACPTISFFGNSDYHEFWEWSFGDGGTASMADPIHTYGSIGNYPLQLIASNGCRTDTVRDSIEIACTIGMAHSITENLSVIPNPNAGAFTLAGKFSGNRAIHCTIFDPQGHPLLTKNLEGKNGEWTEAMDLHASPGIYLLLVTVDDQRFVRRICVQ